MAAETDEKYLIYGLKDPTTGSIRYVGKSSTGLKRPTVHRCRCRDPKNKSHLANWVRGLEAIGLTYEIVILEVLPDNTAFREAEPKWITKLRNEGHDLTNATAGGEGIVGYRHTDETRKKMGDTRKGRVFSPEHRAALSKARKGKKLNLTEAGRRRISESKKGKKYRLGAVVSAETRAKISAKLTGRTLSVEQKALQRKRHAKYAKPFSDQYGNVYSSTKDAVARLGVEISSLVRVLKGRLKSTKGYRFHYLNSAHRDS